MRIPIFTMILACATSVALAQTPANSKKGDAARAAKATPSEGKANQRAGERALTEEERELARLVIVGRVPCELGQFVTVTADTQSPGYFVLQFKKKTYRMFAVQGRTGALRLETHAGDALWLQLASKSMLMDAKRGQRVADVCNSPEQLLVAQSYEKSPPPGLLDGPMPDAAPVQTCDRSSGQPAETRDVAKTC